MGLYVFCLISQTCTRIVLPDTVECDDLVIFFNVPEVKDYLLKNGEVYTLRRKRGVGVTDAVTGSYYKKKVFAKVGVQEVMQVRVAVQLNSFIDKSGLKCTTWGWLAKARKLSKLKADFPYLYRVTVIK